MAVNQADVRKIAKLARIAISDAEAAAMEGELNNILGWVEQLGEVDVTGVEPMTAVIPNALRLRADEINADPLTGGGLQAAVLANAPAPQHGFFGVPKVIE
jgi:aspartyl-tRNA(Asn)/glutamyl-tRNA(Gln) amidotransferase subunit C